MIIRWTGLCLCAFLYGCASSPQPAPGYLPVNAFDGLAHGQDPTVAATQDALIAFAYPARMQGDPAGMALAIASLDSLAGQFSYVDGDAALQLQSAQARVRQILGVPALAKSQLLIDKLVSASQALQSGNQPAAVAALTGPEFTLGPAQTLTVLAHFPYLPDADAALMAASNAEFPQDGGGRNGT
jgi:hypothetical protein